MFKKILTGAILLVLLTAGILIASMETPAVHVTIRDSDYNTIPDHRVDCTYNGVTTTKYTNDDGTRWFGWNPEEGYYYIETVIDGRTYYRYVWHTAGEQNYITICAIQQ